MGYDSNGLYLARGIIIFSLAKKAPSTDDQKIFRQFLTREDPLPEKQME